MILNTPMATVRMPRKMPQPARLFTSLVMFCPTVDIKYAPFTSIAPSLTHFALASGSRGTALTVRLTLCGRLRGQSDRLSHGARPEGRLQPAVVPSNGPEKLRESEKRRKSNAAGLKRRCLAMQVERRQDAIFKFLVRCGPGHGVAGVRHQPKLDAIWRGLGKNDGMARADGSVGGAVDQQHRNLGMRYACERAGLEEINAVTPSRVEHRGSDHGPAESASEPGTNMERP